MLKFSTFLFLISLFFGIWFLSGCNCNEKEKTGEEPGIIETSVFDSVYVNGEDFSSLLNQSDESYGLRIYNARVDRTTSERGVILVAIRQDSSEIYGTGTRNYIFISPGQNGTVESIDRDRAKRYVENIAHGNSKTKVVSSIFYREMVEDKWGVSLTGKFLISPVEEKTSKSTKKDSYQESNESNEKEGDKGDKNKKDNNNEKEDGETVYYAKMTDTGSKESLISLDPCPPLCPEPSKTLYQSR